MFANTNTQYIKTIDQKCKKLSLRETMISKLIQGEKRKSKF